MTANQIRYQEMITNRAAQQETARHNLASEGTELIKANAAASQASAAHRTVDESIRHNYVQEGLAQSTLAETHRANLAKENESIRHNQSVESETARHNVVQEALDSRSNDINQQRADTDQQRADQTYETNVRQILESNRHNLAVEGQTKWLDEQTVMKWKNELQALGIQLQQKDAELGIRAQEAYTKSNTIQNRLFSLGDRFYEGINGILGIGDPLDKSTYFSGGRGVQYRQGVPVMN